MVGRLAKTNLSTIEIPVPCGHVHDLACARIDYGRSGHCQHVVAFGHCELDVHEHAGAKAHLRVGNLNPYRSCPRLCVQHGINERNTPMRAAAECVPTDLSGLTNPNRANVGLIKLYFYPDGAQVGERIQRFSRVHVLPFSYFAFSHNAVRGGVDRQVNLRLWRTRDSVNLRGGQSPKFKPSAGSGHEVFRTGDCLWVSAGAKALAVFQRKPVFLGGAEDFGAVDQSDLLTPAHGLPSEIDEQLVNASADAGADRSEFRLRLFHLSNGAQGSAEVPAFDLDGLNSDLPLLLIAQLECGYCLTARTLGPFRGSSRLRGLCLTSHDYIEIACSAVMQTTVDDIEHSRDNYSTQDSSQHELLFTLRHHRTSKDKSEASERSGLGGEAA